MGAGKDDAGVVGLYGLGFIECRCLIAIGKLDEQTHREKASGGVLYFLTAVTQTEPAVSCYLPDVIGCGGSLSLAL